MAAARACLLALVVAAALFLEEGAAVAAGNAGPASLRQRRRQLLRQRQVRSHLKRLNKAPLATIEVPAYTSVSSLLLSPVPTRRAPCVHLVSHSLVRNFVFFALLE